MDQARVVFADNLTRKVFRVSGQLISKIDIVLNYPALFEKLVREGTIKRDEADFLVEHISEFTRKHRLQNSGSSCIRCKIYKAL